MNKNELVTRMVQILESDYELKATKKETTAQLEAFIKAVTEELQNGGKVQLVGFGTFEVVNRAERSGVNPQTKEKITIPASKAPKFKAGKALKVAVIA